MNKEYETYLPLLQKSYMRAAYWHGTGRYHYHHSADSRYGGITHTRIINVLESVLDNGGLNGHQDLWVKIDGQIKKTVSVAPSRMHARLYAHIHLYKDVWLKYVFGGTGFWMGFFIFFAGQELFSQFGRGERDFLHQIVFKQNFIKLARTWASAICNVDSYKILPWWRAYDLRSDIEGNHPVLLGISKSAVEGEGVVPFLRRVEVRVEGAIPLRYFTHIEVPLAHVEETRALLAQKNISLPVIPLELGELCSSQFPLEALAYA